MNAFTEEEAKGKWCPFARVWLADELGGVSVNRLGDTAKTVVDNAMCIGSLCMAWQWHAWRCGEGCGTRRAGTIEPDYREPCKPPSDQKYYDHIGYCGLAGRL